jgi:hypothetical protein
MSATITGGVNSIVVSIATPYESDGTTIRDDLSGVKIWVSGTSGFIPSTTTLAYNGSGLSVTLPGYTASTTYYVRYSLISDIDPDETDISTEYSVIPKSLSDLELTAPPTPTGVNVTASISYVFVETAAQTFSMGHGAGKVQVYAINTTANPNTPLTLDNAKLQVEFTGTIGSFNSDPGTSWTIWVKWVTKDGVAGPAYLWPNSVTTGQNVSKLVSAMTGPGNPFTILTQSTVKDGVTYPAGTYSSQAFIFNAQIGNAQIQQAAIDDAKIANLSASKLTAGDGTIGGTLKSSNYVKGNNGWAVNTDGTAEFSAASIRGQLTAGQINSDGLTIWDASHTYKVLDTTLSIQEQILPYAPNATAGTTLNFDPTCSVTTVWESSNIATITGGLIGNSALVGSNGEWLVEGLTAAKAYKINYDPQRRYQISALIRKTSGVTSGTVHLGLLEYDASGTAQYSWGGFLQGAIPANSLTTTFKRYYVTFVPATLNAGTAKVALHVILGYPNTGGGRVEIQDIKVDDITLANNISVTAASNNAIDNTTKINQAKTDIYGNTLSSVASNIMKEGFILQTPGFPLTNGSGVGISRGGIVGKKNGVSTFAIGSDGNAIFSGTLEINSQATSKTVITNDKIEVWNGGVRRVVLGKLD